MSLCGDGVYKLWRLLPLISNTQWQNTIRSETVEQLFVASLYCLTVEWCASTIWAVLIWRVLNKTVTSSNMMIGPTSALLRHRCEITTSVDVQIWSIPSMFWSESRIKLSKNKEIKFSHQRLQLQMIRIWPRPHPRTTLGHPNAVTITASSDLEGSVHLSILIYKYRTYVHE